MRNFALSVLVILQASFQIATSQGAVSLDPKIDSCPRGSPDYEEYKKLLVITDLLRTPLSDIAKKEIMPENKAPHNLFLACSWKAYNYMSSKGDVLYENIEKALTQAIVKQIGDLTGPGNNLSKAEAKQIVNECRHPSGITPGLKAIQVQNCILQRIKRFAEF